ncbi:hypothetical protein AX15_007580, partial [Amanita polypyramis BW_CC]
MGHMTPPAAGGAEGGSLVDNPGLCMVVSPKEVDSGLKKGACSGGGMRVTHLTVNQGQKIARVTSRPDEAGQGWEQRASKRSALETVEPSGQMVGMWGNLMLAE